MKRLDLILNGKGGVGKSFFAVNFVQFLKDKGFAHVAIDSDNENSTLKRFHPDTRFLDLDNRRELDGIFTALEKANLVVMDCRAASTDLFIDYFTEIDLPAVLSAMGAALTLIMPVNHEADSVDQIQRLADQFGKQCGYVVVRNAAHSDSFALFESSEVRAQLKDKLGGREIAMSRLQDWLVEALNAENLTITAATKHSSFSLRFSRFISSKILSPGPNAPLKNGNPFDSATSEQIWFSSRVNSLAVDLASFRFLFNSALIFSCEVPLPSSLICSSAAWKSVSA